MQQEDAKVAAHADDATATRTAEERDMEVAKIISEDNDHDFDEQARVSPRSARASLNSLSNYRTCDGNYSAQPSRPSPDRRGAQRTGPGSGGATRRGGASNSNFVCVCGGGYC